MGGAIDFATGSTGELSGGLISDNKARYGGGAGLGESTQIAMRDPVQIQGNNADWGGGLYINSKENGFVFEGGIISGNKAQSGGGIYNRYANTFVLNGGTIEGNLPDDIFEARQSIASP
jgi:hypothetical protein